LQKRIYRPQFQHLVHLLTEVFTEGKIADKILPVYLKLHKSLGAKDRRFIAESFYETVRYYYRYEAILKQLKLQPNIALVLGMHLLEAGYTLPTFEEFEGLPTSFPTDVFDTLSGAEKESFPPFLAQKIVDAHGHEMLHLLNQSSAVFIRVYGNEQWVKKSVAQITKEGFELEETAIPKAYLVKNPKQLSLSKAYLKGLFDVQDIGSQAIGWFCTPKEGDIFVDACAGAGGKALQILDTYRNSIKLVASDINSWKLKNLVFRAERANVPMPKIMDVESLKNVYKGKADYVLLDAPCTGLGVIGRKADSKYRVTAKVLKETCALQADILEEYKGLLKVGGTMVYATCSVLPEENDAQVHRFLKANTNFKLVEEKQILPFENGDGFYMAKLIKEL